MDVNQWIRCHLTDMWIRNRWKEKEEVGKDIEIWETWENTRWKWRKKIETEITFDERERGLKVFIMKEQIVVQGCWRNLLKEKKDCYLKDQKQQNINEKGEKEKEKNKVNSKN